MRGTERVIARGTAARNCALAALLALLVFAALAASAQAAGTPAWQLQVIHAPTNVPIQPAVNEVQTVTIFGSEGGVPNAGKFQLFFENPEGKEGHTRFLPFNASAKEVQEALEKARSIGEGNVEVTGGPTEGAKELSWTYTITFVGALAGQELEELEVEEAEGKAPKGETAETAEVETEIVTNGSHDTIVYDIVATNIGGASSTGKTSVTVGLPNHVTTKEAAFGSGWTCKPASKGVSAFTCSREAAVPGGSEPPPIHVEGYVDAAAISEGEQLVTEAVISGGGAATGAKATDTATVSNTPASFGIYNGSFLANAYGPHGELDKQAGSHPYSAMTSFFFNTVPRFNTGRRLTEAVLPGNLKDAFVTLPAGFIGNPQAVPRCSQREFTKGTIGGPEPRGHCPENTRVGTAFVYYNTLGEPEKTAFYNLVPPPGAPAEFGLIFKNVPVRVDGHLVRQPNGEYRVGVLSADVNEAFNIVGVTISLWGLPADPSHDADREGHAFEGEARPFLTNPTDCLASAAEPPTTTITYDRWEQPGALDAEGIPLFGGANWLQTQFVSPPVIGCEKLKFEPQAGFEPETTKAAAPSGYKFSLDVPNNEEPGGLAVPELKDTTVTLPPGVSLSPSAANGLLACSEQEIDITSTRPGNCPPASQVGTVSITSQLLEAPLTGRVYVGQPECSPCSPQDAESGRIFKLFIEAEGSGVRVKLPGSASVNQATGQISTTFANNPQTPFTHLELNLKGGPGATLANPITCGTYEALGVFTPWSVGGTTPLGEVIPGDEPAHTSSKFAIDWDGSGGACPGSLPFSPGFQAGTASPAAGAYSPFDVVFGRGDDREQTFSGTTVVTPPGLLGKLAGIQRCHEPQASAGTCPASSQIAVATSVAGAGTQPYVVSGPVYLTDGYKGAPFGLSIAVPAKAGPFNLGTVVVRAAIVVDKTTSAITITSDPLPQAVDGVPFRLKQIEVKVDRPEFMFNATNCEPKAITATLTGAPQRGGEAAAAVTKSAPYTAQGCSGLPFSPEITAKTNANVSRSEGTSFEVTVHARKGDANIHKVELQLPTTLPSRLTTLHEACAAAQFDKSPAGCNPHSMVGTAEAITPLLSVPLKGKAYLVSHGGAAFPDLVFLLEGEGIKIELIGNTDIKNGITYSRFETVPDAPVTSFKTVFPRGPFSILSGFGDLCTEQPKAPTKIVGQNGMTVIRTTKIQVEGCANSAKASLAIKRVRVKGNSLSVTVQLGAAGTVHISGGGVKSMSRSLSAGAHTVTVKLSKAGLTAKKAKKKISLKVSLSGSSGSASKTAKVKL